MPTTASFSSLLRSPKTSAHLLTSDSPFSLFTGGDGDFATADIGGASVRTRKKKARERLIDVVVDDRASPGGKSIIIIVFPARSRCLFHARSAQSITSRCFIRLIVTCLCGIRDRRRPATRSKRSKERKKLIHPLTSPRSSDADRPQNLSTSPKTGLLQGAGL